MFKAEAEMPWLRRQGERLDRPIAWVVRALVEKAMEEPSPEQAPLTKKLAFADAPKSR